MVHDASDLGYRSVVFNNRGTGDTKLKVSNLDVDRIGDSRNFV